MTFLISPLIDIKIYVFTRNTFGFLEQNYSSLQIGGVFVVA